MAFITRCPSCGTSFKVVADQLKIADGWVRCGHCQQVFDATLDLQPAFPASPPSLPSPPPAAAEPAEAESAPASLAVPVPTSRPVMPVPPPAPADTELAFTEVRSASIAPADGREPAVDLQDGRMVTDHDAGGPDPFTGFRAPDAAPAMPIEPRWDDTPQPPAPASAAPAPAARNIEAPAEPSFVRQARRRAFWRRPLVRVVLLLGAFGLMALLAGQAVWHWREALTAHYPPTRPWVAAFCERLGCSLAPARRPGDVVIEGSVLLRRAPDRYSFHLVVRNNAATEVAAPALELTLTDLQDQLLVRRVWPAEAWPQPTAVLAPQSEWPLQFELVFDHPQASRMTGYRAVLFYP